MCFQMAASVAQIGFGRLADRWRPRLLVMTGPIVSVSVLSLIGLATSPAMLAVILIAGGLGAAAFHPPAAALAHRLGGDRPGLAMSVYITGGTLGFSFGPLMFAPFAERFGLDVDAAPRAARTRRRRLLSHARAGDAAPPVVERRVARASAVCQAARAPLHHRRAAHADGDFVCDLRAR